MGANKYFVIGSAVKLTCAVNLEGASVTVKIKDSTEVVKVSDVSMVAETSTVFTYIYQNQTTDPAGDYIVTYTISHNGYNVIKQDVLTFVEPS